MDYWMLFSFHNVEAGTPIPLGINLPFRNCSANESPAFLSQDDSSTKFVWHDSSTRQA